MMVSLLPDQLHLFTFGIPAICVAATLFAKHLAACKRPLSVRLHAAKCVANSVAAGHIAGIPNVNRCNWSGRRETVIHGVVKDTILAHFVLNSSHFRYENEKKCL